MAKDEAGFRRSWMADVEQVKRQLKGLNRGVLNPRSMKVQIWDMVTVAALVFTAIVTPFEVCFIYAPISPETAAQWVLLDILVQLSSDKSSHSSMWRQYNLYPRHPRAVFPSLFVMIQGGFERSQSARLSSTPLKSGWFFLDFVSVIPFDLLAIGGAFDVAPNRKYLRLLLRDRWYNAVRLFRRV